MALKGKGTTNDEQQTTNDEQQTTNDEQIKEGTPMTEETKEVVVKEETDVPAVFDSSKVTAYVAVPAIREVVDEMDIYDAPIVKANNGSHEGSDGTYNFDLGKVIKFQAVKSLKYKRLAFDDQGDPDEAKNYFAGCPEGGLTWDGKTIKEAKEDAIEAGYTDAQIRDYVYVYALILECEDEDFIGEVVAIQMSVSSWIPWSKLEKKIKMKAALGKLKGEPVAGDPENGLAVVFESTATGAKNKQGKSYTKFVTKLA
jgi:hypothetical protein